MAATRTYQELFESRAATEAPWLADLRARAFAHFARDGFPSTKVEEWKYADLGRLARSGVAAVSGADVTPGEARGAIPHLALPADSHRIVFVNGRYVPDLSDAGALPTGATVIDLATAFTERPDLLEGRLTGPDGLAEKRLSGATDSRPFALVSLNTAFAADGVVIHLENGVGVELPIHVIHLAVPSVDDTFIPVRNLIVAEAGASALVFETHAAANERAYFTNAVTEIHAARDAHLRHYRWQDESHSAFHISTILARLGASAAYDSFVLATGGAYARDEIRVDFEDEHVHCRLNGAYLGRGDQRFDLLTRVGLEHPNGTISETYKAVLDDRARGTFQGRIHVAEGAVKSNAHQLNSNLLLSPDAQADSKPELEILTDDIQASHGATVGDIDEQALFYLRSRGIDTEAARALLIDAFIGDLIDHVGYSTAHDYMRAAFGHWLTGLNRGVES